MVVRNELSKISNVGDYNYAVVQLRASTYTTGLKGYTGDHLQTHTSTIVKRVLMSV